jgi:hypothetical protein
MSQYRSIQLFVLPHDILEARRVLFDFYLKQGHSIDKINFYLDEKFPLVSE